MNFVRLIKNIVINKKKQESDAMNSAIETGTSKINNSICSKFITFLILFSLSAAIKAGSGNWASKTTGGNIVFTSTEPTTQLKDAAGNSLTVVYLENLNIKKLGQNTNADNIAWLLAQGYRVVELDYANHANAVSPNINADIISINDAINAGSFCGLTNCSKYRSYVLFEGYRLARDVAYFKDNPTVYNYPASYTEGDSLYMDIIYPANSEEKVPVILSFSYSNSYAGAANKHQRLNLGNTLAGFDDSILEGAPATGIAWAIADHPKYCPWGNGKPTGGANDTYKSYQVNPDAAQKVKSAVRTLRTVGVNLGLSGKIGIYGFSRGSDAGSMAIGDRIVPEFENAGLNIGVSDDVQAAALGSGVFDFTQIYNATGDGDSNLETRCPWAWGALADNYAIWEKQGSAHLAQTSASAPVLFFYNTTDANYYQDQIQKFKTKLDGLGVTTSTLVNYGTGHAVPQTSNAISSVYNFFRPYLTPPSVYTGLKNNSQSSNALKVWPNPAGENINFTYDSGNATKVNIDIYNISGENIGRIERAVSNAGIQSETISLSEFQLPKGVYYLKIMAVENTETALFMKQ